MRKLALIGIVAFLIITSSAHAQLIQNMCTIQSGVSNTVEGTSTDVTLDYGFNCYADTYNGQVTRMLIRVPYTDITNLEVEDSYGTMEVLEGPAYYSVETKEDESIIGVIFRSGLEITDEPRTYSLTIKFDTNSLVSVTEETYTIKPGGFAVNPKLTIVSPGGITESTTVITSYDYILEFEEEVSVNSISPNICALSDGKVHCENMAGTVFDDIEVKWTITGTSVDGITKWLTEKTGNALPVLKDKLGSAFGNLFELVSGKLSK